MSGVSQSFEESVKKYVTIDNQIKKARDAVKILNKEKGQIAKDIIVYIQSNGIEQKPIFISDNQLMLGVSKQTTSISRKYVEQRLLEYFSGNQDKAEHLTSFIFDNRETVEKPVLKRTKKKA